MRYLSKYYCLLFLTYSFSVVAISAQSFVAGGISSEKFPIIELPFIVYENAADYDINKNISNTDFVVKEDGVIIPNSLLSVDCNPEFPTMQVLFMIDNSTSMGEMYNGMEKIDWVEDAVEAFIKKVNYSRFSNIGINTFATNVYVKADFSNDKDYLTEAVKHLNAVTAQTDFNVAFFDENNGAIASLKRQPNINRIIVFISDGKHTSTFGDLKEEEIQNTLLRNNIRLYTYIVSNELDPSLTAMRNISNNTGGRYNINLRPSDMRNKLMALGNDFKVLENCVLTWNTDLHCESSAFVRDVLVRYKPAKKSYDFEYEVPEWTVFKVDGLDGGQYYFGNPNIDESEIVEIKIKPSPWDMTINSLYLEDDQYFKIIDYGGGKTSMPSDGIHIEANSSYTIQVAFTQHEDYLPRQTKLICKAEPCDREVIVYGGEAKLDAWVDKSVYLSCDEIKIFWDGVPASCRKDIYYSNDWTHWKLIKKNATGDFYSWIPPLMEGKFHIRVIAYPIDGLDNPVDAYTKNFDLVLPALKKLKNSLGFTSTVSGQKKIVTFEDVFENNSDTTVNISGYYLKNNPDNIFSFADTIKKEIPVGDKVDIELMFAPKKIMYYDEQSLMLELECGKDVEIDILGEGMCGFESTDEVNFNEVELNTDSTITDHFFLYNHTNLELEYSIKIKGKDADAFEIISPTPSKSHRVKSYFQENITVNFKPKFVGKHEAEIEVILDQCPNNYIPIIGYGVYSELEINDLDFGRERIKTKFNPLNITIKNKDAVAKKIVGIEYANQNMSSIFTHSQSVPFTIGGNSEYELSIEFYPDDNQTQAYSTQLLFISELDDTLISHIKGETYLPDLEIDLLCPDLEVGDGVAHVILRNNSEDSETYVKEMKIIEGEDEYDWTKSNISDFTIDKQSSVEYSLKFTPVDDSNHKLLVEVLADNYDGSYTEEWKSNLDSISCDALFVDYSNYDFANTMVCDSQVSNIVVTNKSQSIDLVLYCDMADITGPNYEVFDILDQDIVVVAPQETTEIEMTFNPKKLGRHSANLSIPNSTGIDLLIPMTGNSEEIIPTLNPSKVHYDVGDTLYLIFEIDVPDIEPKYISEIEFMLRYDYNFVFPFSKTFTLLVSQDSTDEDFMVIDSIEFIPGEGMYCKLSGNLLAANTYPLFKMKFLGLITEGKETYITVDMIYPCTELTHRIATISRNEVCADNISLVDFSTNQFMLLISEYDNGGMTINYSVPFDIQTKILVYDINGKLIDTLVDETVLEGNHIFYWDSTDIPNGSYLLIMQAGKKIISREFVIKK